MCCWILCASKQICSPNTELAGNKGDTCSPYCSQVTATYV